MYQGYFEAKPSVRAPPIPTAFVDPPGTAAGAHILRNPHNDGVFLLADCCSLCNTVLANL